MRIVRLEEFTNISSGQGAPQGDSSYSYDEGIPFIKARDLDFLTNGGSIHEVQKVSSEVARDYKLIEFPKESIVFAKSGMSAKKDRVHCLDADSYVVNHLAIIEPNEQEFLSSFLTYYLQYYKPSKLIRDEAYPSIRISDIRKLKIPLPSLEKQKAIVAKLDRAQRLIEIDKAMLAKYDQLIQSVFLDMFGDPVTNPKGWEVTELGNYIEYLADIGSNGANKLVAEKLVMSHTPDYAIMVRTVNFTANDFESNVKYVSKEVFDFFKKSQVFGGEMIMNKIGSAGSFWMMPFLKRPVSLGLNQFMIRYTGINPHFVYHFLSTDFGQKVIKSKIRGVATKSITKSAVRELPIYITPKLLQEEFQKKLKRIEDEINEQQNNLLKTQDLFSSLIQEVFR